MPSIISLPPILLDHTFPREVRDLHRVEEALGEIATMAQQNEALILVTDGFRLFLESFNWEEPGVAQKLQIYRLLAELFLVGQPFLVNVDCERFRNADRHPLPENLIIGVDVSLWAEEMAAVLKWHGQYAPDRVFYIGIACANAFAGGQTSRYPEGTPAPRFPIVGPLDIVGREAVLRDAVEFQLPRGIADPPVSFSQAKRNLGLLGAREVVPPRRGSHYRATFPRSRSWILDPNIGDPIPERFLKELEEITGYEYPIICYVLSRGEFPPRMLFYQRPINRRE